MQNVLSAAAVWPYPKALPSLTRHSAKAASCRDRSSPGNWCQPRQRRSEAKIDERRKEEIKRGINMNQ